MKDTLYKQTINFGKVRGEEVTVTVELRGTPVAGSLQGLPYGKLPKDLELSIIGDVWNKKHTDIVTGGQCYDELLELVHEPLMYEIVGVWKRWHLNDLKAGDATQEQWLRENGHGKDYAETCEKLEQAGLLVHEGYRYGSEWKHEELPREIVKQVMGWKSPVESK